jgi:hypothetical protein
VSSSESARRNLAAILADRCSAIDFAPPIEDDRRWPAALTTWQAMPADAAASDASDSPARQVPKLTILLDPPSGDAAAWDALVQQSGRGPTLRIPATNAEVVQDALAAVEAVWPHLGRSGRKRLQ